MERSKKIEAAVAAVLEPFEDGFEVGDIWRAMMGAMDHAQDWFELSEGADKKAFVLEVLGHVLDGVDLPGPDMFSRRVVLYFAPGLIDLLAEQVDRFGSSPKGP